MRRLLFSSIAMVLLCGASCNGGDTRMAQPGESEATRSEKHIALPEDSAKAKQQRPDTSNAAKEAPEHGSPDQQKLDSVKAGFPAKK